MPITTNLDPCLHTGSFELPSCALLYDGVPPVVDVRAFGFGIEDILMQVGPSLRKLIRVLDHVVTNIPPSFSLEDILPGDLYAIIAMARSLTYGENYRFQVSCPQCDHPEIISLKVPQELPVKNWARFKTRAELRQASSISLPTAKDNVILKFLTVRDEMTLEDVNRKAKATSGEESPKVYGIAARIESVNGGSPDSILEAVEYVRMLRGDDMLAVTDAISSLECGIDLSYRLSCDACQHAHSVTIPLSADFFRRNRV